jgi:hypothetical protein
MGSVWSESERGSRRLVRCDPSEESEESEDPYPVSGAGPSTLRGLVHPNASTLSQLRCAMISAVLILG